MVRDKATDGWGYVCTHPRTVAVVWYVAGVRGGYVVILHH